MEGVPNDPQLENIAKSMEEGEKIESLKEQFIGALNSWGEKTIAGALRRFNDLEKEADIKHNQTEIERAVAKVTEQLLKNFNDLIVRLPDYKATVLDYLSKQTEKSPSADHYIQLINNLTTVSVYELLVKKIKGELQNQEGGLLDLLGTDAKGGSKYGQHEATGEITLELFNSAGPQEMEAIFEHELSHKLVDEHSPTEFLAQLADSKNEEGLPAGQNIVRQLLACLDETIAHGSESFFGSTPPPQYEAYARNGQKLSPQMFRLLYQALEKGKADLTLAQYDKHCLGLYKWLREHNQPNTTKEQATTLATQLVTKLQNLGK